MRKTSAGASASGRFTPAGAILRIVLSISLAIAFAPAPPAAALARAGQDGAPAAAPEAALASPREVMETFLGNMSDYRRHGQERFAKAALEAFEIEGDRERSIATAGDLYAAFNRVEWVDFEDVAGPGDPALASGRVLQVFGPPPSDPEARIEIVFVRDASGSWRISKETLERVPEIWARVKDLPLIDDLPFLARVQHKIRAALPSSLLSTGFLLENWQWLGLFVLLFAALILDRVVRVAAGVAVRRLAGRDGSDLRAEAVTGFVRPLGLLVGALFFAGLLPVLDIDPAFLSPIDVAAAFVATAAGVWAVYKLVDVVSSILESHARRTSTRIDDILIPLLRRTLKILVIIVGLVYLASRWTDDLWSIVAGLGVGSLAVAFAGRDTIENLFGTFTVLLDKPFELGDWIKVGGNEGSVEDVGFRSTRIRTAQDSLITIPNRTFVTSDVDNLGRRNYRRLLAVLSLTYDTPPDKIEAFCAGVRRLIERHPYTRKDAFHVYLNSFGPSSLDVQLVAFFTCRDGATELRERHRLLADILRVAERLEVEFAFPTQTVIVTQPDGDARPRAPASEREAEERGQGVADEVLAAASSGWSGDASSVPPPVRLAADPHERRGTARRAER